MGEKVPPSNVSGYDGQDIPLVRASPLFDAAWYLSQYSDVASAGIDPAEHYVTRGGFEGRDPGPAFHSAYYLAANPDVRRAGINPLAHYLCSGQTEGRGATNVYGAWLIAHETLDRLDRAAIQARIGASDTPPTFSIVMPVFNPLPSHLSATLDSVRGQSYPYWQLCIVDDGSRRPGVLDLLRKAAVADARIQLTARRRNGGICTATNTGLKRACGAFVGLLDHDDLLHENALYEASELLQAFPDTSLIYTDSDLVDDTGLRHDPYFKPGWNAELMLGHNLVSHFGLYRRSMVVAAGGMRREYEGSQDWDLALRIAELAGPGRIRHIPTVLYHWRRSEQNESYSDQNAGRCQDAARRAVADHLARDGLAGRMEPSPLAPTFNRFVPALPDPAPTVTVAIIATTGNELGPAVADMLLRTDYQPFDIVVVTPDRATPDLEAALASLGRALRVRILRCAGNDMLTLRIAAIAAAEGTVIVLIQGAATAGNPGWLRELAAQAMRPDVGLVGPVVVDAQEQFLHAGVVLGAPGERYPFRLGYSGAFGMLALTREVSALSPACVAFRRDTAEFFQPDCGLLAVSEALRHHGRCTLVTPFAVLVRPDAVPPEPVPQSAEDLFYNPNLALDPLLRDLATPSRRVRPWAAERRRLLVREGQAQRAAVLLDGIDRSARLLEVGASYSPVAPRADGWNTAIVDHAPREALARKYAGEPDVWVERIEEVDFIWSEGTLADAVPAARHGMFDVLVASHMIEHTPDLIGFFSAAQAILQPKGAIVLAVPDKRYCFDYFRPISLTHDVLEAHEVGRTRHTRRTAFAHHAYTILNGGVGAWGQHALGDLRFPHSFSVAMAKLRAMPNEQDSPYVDLHGWTFTPSSFQLILLELARLTLCDWQVQRITPALGCEFHVRLRRGALDAVRAIPDDAFDARRLALLQAMLCESVEQVAHNPALA